MNASVIILSAAAVGFTLNTLSILGIAWRGGRLLGKMEGTLDRLEADAKIFHTTQREHGMILTRTVVQLDGLERRVTRLEEGP